LRWSPTATGRQPALSFRLAAVGALLAAVLAALALVAPAQAKSLSHPKPWSHAKQLSKADREFVDATVEAAMEESGQPGISISISCPKGDYTRTYGVSDIERRKPLRLSDHFHMGSITKTFTATAILRQVDKGRLRLSDKLDKFVRGIPNGDRITVRHLLAMQSGVFEYQADPEFQQEIADDLFTDFGPWDVVKILRRNEPYFAPGEGTMYTNSGYILLGLILEKVTGRSAEEAITRDVIKPLGLRHTSFPTTPRMPYPFTRGYCGAPGALEDCTHWSPGIVWTAGAMISTIGDLHKYARQLATGALLSRKLHAERLQFNEIPYGLEGPPTFGYGLGIIRFGTWLGHNGSVPGASTEAFYEPRTGAVIAGMENLQTPSFSIFTRIYVRIADHLYPGSVD
jgi:D-alanyl-D-alanine carboxypeptidase